MRAREFEMIGCARRAEHDPVEVAMTFETVEDLQAQTIAIERDERIDIVGRAGYPQSRGFEHRRHVRGRARCTQAGLGIVKAYPSPACAGTGAMPPLRR